MEKFSRNFFVSILNVTFEQREATSTPHLENGQTALALRSVAQCARRDIKHQHQHAPTLRWWEGKRNDDTMPDPEEVRTQKIAARAVHLSPSAMFRALRAALCTRASLLVFVVLITKYLLNSFFATKKASYSQKFIHFLYLFCCVKFF